MVNLFVSYYNEKNVIRSKEIKMCLVKNKTCKSISNIFVLSEINNDKFLEDNNFDVISINNRPTFNDFIDVVNKITTKEDINIISNSDILFDDSLDVLNDYELKGHSFALTRWQLNNNGKLRLTELPNSQDVWIFKGNIININANFNIGIPGCDNRLAYEIKRVGYSLSNPSISIKTFHNHQSNYRPDEYKWYSHDYFIGEPHQHIIPDTIENIMGGGSVFSIFSCGNIPDQLYSLKIKRWNNKKRLIGYSREIIENGLFIRGMIYQLITQFYKIPLETFILYLFYHNYYKKYIS